MSKKPSRRPATYPEICLAGPVGVLQEALCAQGKMRDIHDMARRMDNLSLLQSERTNKTDLFVQWSIYQWVNNKKPLFVLEKELAWALSNTEPPMEKFDLLPELPIDGMYVCLPPVFDLDGGATGNHKVEGLFLTKNEVLVPKDGTILEGPASMVDPERLSDFDIIPSITILGVGEDKNKSSKSGWLRDDAIIYFSLVPGKPLYLDNDKHLGVVELTRVVANLLYLLQNTHELLSEKDPALPSSLLGDSRSARRERERDLDKGRSCLPHTVWKLSSLERKPPKDSEPGTEPEQKMRGHIVLGHIHNYWVLDPGKSKSLSTKKVSTKTRGERIYHLVSKWILPYVRGEGPVEHAPTVLIR